MFRIELSNGEREILEQILQDSLTRLELEILHTDHNEFKALLKHRRDVLQRLANKMPQPMPAAV